MISTQQMAKITIEALALENILEQMGYGHIPDFIRHKLGKDPRGDGYPEYQFLTKRVKREIPFRANDYAKLEEMGIKKDDIIKRASEIRLKNTGDNSNLTGSGDITVSHGSSEVEALRKRIKNLEKLLTQKDKMIEILMKD